MPWQAATLLAKGSVAGCLVPKLNSSEQMSAAPPTRMQAGVVGSVSLAAGQDFECLVACTQQHMASQPEQVSAHLQAGGAGSLGHAALNSFNIGCLVARYQGLSCMTTPSFSALHAT